MRVTWSHVQQIGSKVYTCGYCGSRIASDKGFLAVDSKGNGVYIYICHQCTNPTYIDVNGKQYPGTAFGDPVNGITDQSVLQLYEEARRCTSSNSNTASVLCCRKLLMNIAVSKGAAEGLSFIEYVEYLSIKNYVPPGGKEWVDHIRTKGNEANHEIKIMSNA